MRVLYVAYAPLSQQGAVPVHVGAIAGGLASRGHSVTIIAPEFAKPYSLDAVEVKYIPSNISKAPFWARTAGRWIKDNRKSFDIAYVRDFYNGNKILLDAKKAGLPVILEVNGSAKDEAKRASLKSKAAALLDWYFSLKKRIHISSGVIAVSPELGKTLAGFDPNPNKTHFLPNGVDINLYNHQIKKSILREKLGLPNDGPLIGNVGSILPYHLDSPIIEVVEKLALSFPKIKCLIVGGGSAENQFRKKIESSRVTNKFIVTGRVSQNESVNYIRALDIAVTWSAPLTARLGWPMRLSTYAASAIPIVAPDWGVYNFFAEKGALVPAKNGTAEATVDAIRSLLMNKKYADNVAENGRKLAETELGWDVIVEKTERIMLNAINSNRSENG
ncbi:glycosyltransferase family 4 protein [bacterium]|nr:glycosyltransferase family 4 protein [bacterium]